MAGAVQKGGRKVVRLETREARRSLARQKHPYWRPIDKGLHLGYFKGAGGGGTWLMRRYLGERRYQEEKIGHADDVLASNSETILTFYEAQNAARARAERAEAEGRARARGPAPTVRVAVEGYLANREAHGRKRQLTTTIANDGRYRLARYVLAEPIADKLLAELDDGDLRSWRSAVGKMRSRAGSALKPATVARTVNDFKAALNEAAELHKKHLPPDFERTIRSGLKAPKRTSTTSSREHQALSEADLRALIAAAREFDAEKGWGGDLVRMVTLLAATGARFSQVARIEVAGVLVTKHRVMVPASRKGRARDDERPPQKLALGDDVLKLLGPVLNGRHGHEPLLLRPRWKQVAPTEWVQVGRSPWQNPSELARPWKEIRERAGLPAEIVPYAFRHSSIIRALRAGLPVQLVAKMHDTSAAMIEAHYSTDIADALDDLKDQVVVRLVSGIATRLTSVGTRDTARHG